MEYYDSTIRIDVTSQNLALWYNLAYQGIHEANAKTPQYFRTNGKLSIFQDDTIAFVSKPEARNILFENAVWVKWCQNKEQKVLPPIEAIDSVLIRVDKTLPELNAVARNPIFNASGILDLTPGYHPADKLWYIPQDDLKGLEIPDVPTEAEVKEAIRLLMDEVLFDFPFADDGGSKINALALILLPYVRQMINGPLPLFAFTSPNKGEGKTLIVKLAYLIATGLLLESQTYPGAEDERRKRITSLLRGCPTVVLFDNVTHKDDMGGDALESVLTSTTWADRLLNTNETLRLRNDAIWTMTGTNTRFTEDIKRRVIYSRLCSTLINPWTRNDFKHPDLLEWVRESRKKLVIACLTIIQNWIAKDKPLSKSNPMGFPAFVKVMGGILEAAGVKGLWSNYEEAYASNTNDVTEIVELFAQWPKDAKQLTARQLMDLAHTQYLYKYVDSASAMGGVLAYYVDRPLEGIGILRIVAGSEKKKSRLYYIEPLKEAEQVEELLDDAEPPDENRWSRAR